jgi:hypothetical protein
MRDDLPVQDVHLVVTSPRRRTRAALPGLSLVCVTGQSPETRAAEWLGRLAAAREAVSLRELYAGNHWRAARSLAGAITPGGYRVRVWVCSPGLGLLAWNEVVPPCAASFTPGDRDCISRRGGGPEFRAELRQWWRLLAAWPGPTPGQPRSLTALAAQHLGEPILVAASEVGLHALADDLAEILRSPGGAHRTSILATGRAGLEALADHLTFCDHHHCRRVGGTLEALPVRVARAVLLNWCDSRPIRPNVSRALDEMLADAPMQDIPVRPRRASAVLALLRPRRHARAGVRGLARLFRRRHRRPFAA